MTLADWLIVIEIAATLAFAISGLIVAAREKLDVVGAAVVAIAASFGGRSSGSSIRSISGPC